MLLEVAIECVIWGFFVGLLLLELGIVWVFCAFEQWGICDQKCSDPAFKSYYIDGVWCLGRCLRSSINGDGWHILVGFASTIPAPQDQKAGWAAEEGEICSMQKSGKYSILNSIIQLLRLPPSHVVLQLRAMSSSKGWMHPYQVKCFMGVLEAQEHVLQDRQSPLPHNGVQQLGEDLVGREKQVSRQDGIKTCM